MLFNSYAFILVYLPLVLFGFFRIGRHSHTLALIWLASASLFFYGWWDIRFVVLLVGSIAFNYGAGFMIVRSHAGTWNLSPRLITTLAITVDFGLLGYFKYVNFLVENVSYFTGASLGAAQVILPLGISFFTFTQIAFLVDTCQGKVKELKLVNYALFVTYFPHLIAGPVLHHKEMMPQFARLNVCRINWRNIAAGLSIFVLGLAKKTMVADAMADFATPIFSAVAAGGQPMLLESWIATLAYTLQLYFDFSGYSDMAIGLSLIFNVRLPMNFNSPYKAVSIIEFWRRWHMTLSRFLRDYLYIPLGGSRNGNAHRYLNLMITMLLGGLWHGAGWTFVVWGGLHGLYLTVNHLWRSLKDQQGWRHGGVAGRVAGCALTFLAVAVGWVFFRADSLQSAIVILEGMCGLHGVSLPQSLEVAAGKAASAIPWIAFKGINTLAPSMNGLKAMEEIVVFLLMVWFMPNIAECFRRCRPTFESVANATNDPSPRAGLQAAWRPSLTHAVISGALLFGALMIIGSNHKSEFLYFQF